MEVRGRSRTYCSGVSGSRPRPVGIKLPGQWESVASRSPSAFPEVILTRSLVGPRFRTRRR